MPGGGERQADVLSPSLSSLGPTESAKWTNPHIPPGPDLEYGGPVGLVFTLGAFFYDFLTGESPDTGRRILSAV